MGETGQANSYGLRHVRLHCKVHDVYWYEDDAPACYLCADVEETSELVIQGDAWEEVNRDG